MCDTDWFEMDIEVGIAKNADISISYRYCLEIFTKLVSRSVSRSKWQLSNIGIGLEIVMRHFQY